MIEYVTDSGGSPSGAIIRAIGIGGGGCNAIDNLKKDGVFGVDFIAANSDVQALQKNTAEIKIQVGKNTAKGLGVGGNPEVGKKCVEESIEDIKKHLLGSNMVFISAGMGGGTGTGGAPQISQIAKDLGALVIAIVTKPFKFEGTEKQKYAEKGIEELRKHVDSIIVVSNQKLLEGIDKSIPVTQATRKVDEVLINASKGIVDIIHKPGLINIDFADIKNVMLGSGDALIGIGKAKGENRAAQATQNALNCPLLDGVTITGAKGVLINITADSTFSMEEIEIVTDLINEASGVDPYVKCGIVITEEATEEFTVTVLATKFEKVAAEIAEPTVIEIPAVPNAQAAPARKAKNDENDYHHNNNDGKYYNPRSGSFVPPQPVSSPIYRTAAASTENKKNMPYDSALNPYNAKVPPRGNEELKRTDIPAYERVEKPIMVAKTGTYAIEGQMTQMSYTPANEESSAPRKVQDRPVFLRRLMD